MRNEFDKVWYFELLRRKQRLNEKSRSLYMEDRDTFFELLEYELILSDQIYWGNRKNYFSIMNNFINEKLTAEDFKAEFLYLWEKDRDMIPVNFEPNMWSKGFAKWIDRIVFPCENFEPEDQENKEYGENDLKDSVRDFLIRIPNEYNFNANAD